MPGAAKPTVYGFETSNNLKVRIALAYKGIAHEFRVIDPGDRSEVVRLSGQHLTPVMVHGDTVLFDSAAILRYLDANFPDTPKLFGDSRDEQWEIEDWELFARRDLAGPMMEFVHQRVSRGDVDEVLRDKCATAFAQPVTTLANRMTGREWLVGSRMSAADITAAAVIHRVRSARIFPLPRSADRLLGWVERVVGWLPR